MAGEEHQAEHVVLDVVDGGVEVGHVDLLEPVSDFGGTAAQGLRAPEVVDGAALRDGHQPGARVPWYAGFRPLLQRGDQSVLREILGKPEVVSHPGQTGDEPGRLVAPNGRDC